MTDIPVFLDRKKNPTPPATLEERREYAARWPAPKEEPVAATSLFEDRKEERKEASRARIKRMKARIQSGQSLVGKIPDQYLRWNTRLCRFEDARVKEKMLMSMAKKIARYNELARERNLPERKWFPNLKAVEAAIAELAPATVDTPLSNVPSSSGGVRGASSPDPEAMTTTQPKEPEMAKTATARKTTKKTSPGRVASGQEPNAKAFKPIRPGTVRAKVLELMVDGSKTAQQIATRCGIDPKMVMAHAYCTWRDAGIGYAVNDGKLKAKFPQGVTFARAIKKTDE